MTLGEAKDIVREHFGRLGFNTPMVIQALNGGRRLIEQHANFWWMRAEKTFNLVVDQGSYLIKVSTSNGLNLPLFKDPAGLAFKVTGETQWEPVGIGRYTKSDLDLMYATDDEGPPEEAVIDNVSLVIYPPDPQDTYDMILYYWGWTANQTSNVETDDLLSFFPDALIFAACMWGYQMVLKDFGGADYWMTLLGGKPFGRAGQLALLKKENFKRTWQEIVTFEPHIGPPRHGRRRMDNVQIYR